MTQDEIIQFQEEIRTTILPNVINMPENKIAEIIDMVARDNPDLPDGFAHMILEQILELKSNSAII